MLPLPKQTPAPIEDQPDPSDAVEAQRIDELDDAFAAKVLPAHRATRDGFALGVIETALMDYARHCFRSNDVGRLLWFVR